MLKHLLPSRRQRPVGPPDVRLYAIGDVHGRADLLDDLIRRIDEDPAEKPKRLIFLGDYVDRGSSSAAVIDRLLAISTAGRDAVFLKGNHEAAMLDFLDAPMENFAWLDWGGEATLESYGVDLDPRRTAADMGAELRGKVPAAHLTFLRNLAITHEEGDYFFVHAGVRPGTPLNEQTEEDLLWIREEFHAAAADQRPDKTVVHGHHPTRRPVDNGWRIGVDTGAVWTGILTAVVIDGPDRRFIATAGKPSE
ncbi:MAG: serine/threonine protein phosphatase [Alphaproteobacteria bacterium]|nr:serine/threonine protein phosphatase [Alphaproteobacteria bacterium]